MYTSLVHESYNITNTYLTIYLGEQKEWRENLESSCRFLGKSEGS